MRNEQIFKKTFHLIICNFQYKYIIYIKHNIIKLHFK